MTWWSGAGFRENFNLPHPRVTVVIPTLNAGSPLVECVRSLRGQTSHDFEVLIVDNSGRRAVRDTEAAALADGVIENEENAGFGAAINQGYRRSHAPFLATLNYDAVDRKSVV